MCIVTVNFLSPIHARNTPAAMQIRYLETLTQMARSTGASVIFMPASSGLGTTNSVGSSSSGNADLMTAGSMQAIADASILQSIAERAQRR